METKTELDRRDAQYRDGLQVIERAIIAGVAEGGGQLGTHNFRWNHGIAFVPGHPPSAVLPEVLVPGRPAVEETFSREEVEDTWNRLDRFDVRSRVERIIEQLTKP